jgi:hypothetical protein
LGGDFVDPVDSVVGVADDERFHIESLRMVFAQEFLAKARNYGFVVSSRLSVLVGGGFVYVSRAA